MHEGRYCGARRGSAIRLPCAPRHRGEKRHGQPANARSNSTESYEDAANKIADQLDDSQIADQLIEFTITALRFRRGGFAGFPPTYIVEASVEDSEAESEGGYGG